MAEQPDKRDWHKLDKIVDFYDHYQSETEELLDKAGESASEKYKHLQPYHDEEETEFF